jgi:hypothetical protein
MRVEKDRTTKSSRGSEQKRLRIGYQNLDMKSAEPVKYNALTMFRTCHKPRQMRAKPGII